MVNTQDALPLGATYQMVQNILHQTNGAKY